MMCPEEKAAWEKEFFELPPLYLLGYIVICIAICGALIL